MNLIIRGAIYRANLEPIKGSEQGGCRPVLVIQNNQGNTYSQTTIIVPITSKEAKYRKNIHVPITADFLPSDSLVLCEQIRTIDKSRIIHFLGILDESYIKKIEKQIAKNIDIKTAEETL